MSKQIQPWKDTLVAKIVSIGAMIICLMIPLSMIDGIILERKSYSESSIKEVQSIWGNEQTLSGPMMVIPYTHSWLNDKGLNVKTKQYLYYLPEVLDVSGKIVPTIRKRGIYDVILYEADLKVKGEFNRPNFDELGIKQADILWEEIIINVNIPDMRGIKEQIQCEWGDKKIRFQPGVRLTPLFQTGIHAKVELNSEQIAFGYHLNLSGSNFLKIIPSAKQTYVKVTSDWESPSFIGSKVPTKREVTERGFRAEWEYSYFGRNFPQHWRNVDLMESDIKNSFFSSGFGVKLLKTNDFYQQSLRTAKYGALFLLLTFMVYFLFEIFNPIRIHVMQYLLVGFSLCMFYLLLISLSEQTGYNWAYIIASISTIGLISGYSFSILKDKIKTIILGAKLAFLYSYLFVLIQMEDFALLLGSMGLFVILAVVMFLTRHVKWDELEMRNPINSTSEL